VLFAAANDRYNSDQRQRQNHRCIPKITALHNEASLRDGAWAYFDFNVRANHRFVAAG
jgi:hypothetical protein